MQLSSVIIERHGPARGPERILLLAKYLAAPAPGDDPARTFEYGRTVFVVRYVHTERHIEASLYDGDTLVGKFFLLREHTKLPLVFEKFRVPTAGDIVLSFVRE